VDFTIAQRVTRTVEEVQAALLDPAFIAASASLPMLGDSALLDEERSSDRARLSIRRRFTGELNRAVTKVLEADKLTWVEEITFDLSAHRAQHRIVPDFYSDRLSARYATTLAEPATRAGTTERTARGTLTVRAPLVARRVEEAIISGLREFAAAEAALLSSWAG
jgi:hypothetical protein